MKSRTRTSKTTESGAITITKVKQFFMGLIILGDPLNIGRNIYFLRQLSVVTSADVSH